MKIFQGRHISATATLSLLFWLFVFGVNAARADAGSDWLAARAQPDGSYASQRDLATPFQATAEALRAFYRHGQASQPGVTKALQFLENDTYPSTEHLSRRVLVRADAGSGVADAVADLLANANSDGGFGELAGYHATALDTAFALEALTLAGHGNGDAALGAVGYLLGRQRADGGWALSGADSSIYVTALALKALTFHQSRLQGVAGAMASARTFLLAKRDAAGLWGEDFESAAALMALAAGGPEVVDLVPSAEALRQRQTDEGSWSGDVFSTALALRAFSLYQARAGGVNGGRSGTVVGRVVKAESGQPVAGAAVYAASRPDFRTASGADGFFRLTGVAPGLQTLVAQKAGFLGVSQVVDVRAEQESDAGDLVLAYSPETGIVRGFLSDGHDGSPVADARIVLTGPEGHAATSDGRGDFEVAGIAAGIYAVTIEKSGYHALSGELLVAAGQERILRQALIRDGAFLDDAPGDVTGVVVDLATALPLAGAVLALDGGATATADSAGRFRFSALARGSYQVTLAAPGYQSQGISFVFNAGSNGDLGILGLHPLRGASAPGTLTLHGRVLDGVTGEPVAGATVTWPGEGIALQSGPDGTFVLADLEVLDFDLHIAAPGYADRGYSLSATGFGAFQQDFPLPPQMAGGDGTDSTVSGSVTDRATGAAVPGATVRIGGDSTLSAQTDGAGRFEIAGIDTLEFQIRASALGYGDTVRPVTLSAHGSYTLDLALEAIDAGPEAERFQIVSLAALTDGVGARGSVLFEAAVGNLSDQPRDALVIGEILDGAGDSVGTVIPYLGDSDETGSLVSFDAEEVKTLTIPWPVAQAAPGDYRLVLRVVEPGSISRALPTGVVWAEDWAFGAVTATLAFDGALGLEPPLTQAGAQLPVRLDALIVNGGNLPLADLGLTLTVEDPDSGAVLHQADVSLDFLAVGDHRRVSFGEWIPSTEGNLPLRIRAGRPEIEGEIEGELYVGDKASGTFAVDKSVVPEGTRTVRGSVTLEGVDTAIGSAIDPLFFAVRNAVKTGGEYTAREAMVWQRNNCCMGCHIQTQSLVGVASAFQKNLGDEAAAVKLYNTVASSQQNDGGLRANHPQYTRTQTALGAWSLTAWEDAKAAFRTLYKAAKHLYDRRSRSGDQTWWTPDHRSGWWYSNDAQTALVIKAYAHLLSTGAKLDMAEADDYRLTQLTGLGAGTAPRDLEAAPDGYLYSIKRSGYLVRIDPDTGMVETLGERLPIEGYGLAVAEDGSVFVSGNGGKLIRRHPDGTVETLLSGSGILTDVEIGPDGLLHVVDYTNRRILKVTLDGEAMVWASGGLLNQPYGLTLDGEGNAYVANYGAFNIVKIDADGVATVFADGLQYRPVWIDDDGAGGFYFSTASYSKSGQTTPDGLNHLSDRGLVERLASGNTLRGVASFGERLFVVSTNGNALLEQERSPMDTALMPQFVEETVRASNYLLARYRDNSSDNIVQAMRLMGLAEARRVVGDEGLRSQIDTAITAIEQILRARQRGDGGWGRYVSSGSDAMVTALVGLSIDYTNPSANDRLVRRTIEYLLSSQLSDHSWRSNNNLLTTRLAATSLVVAYLPVALERLGGIDVDLHLAFPGNVSLSQPSIAPSAQAIGEAGRSDYLWHLLGVTSSSRELAFDLTLGDLALGEERPVAVDAYIEFQNSFSGEMIRVDLPIPTVRAASELQLSLATDRGTYGANETVAIAVGVDNAGPTAAEGHIELAILAAGEDEPLESLVPLAVPSLAPGAHLPLESQWFTGSQLAGGYEVRARLFDTQGRLLDEKRAPFAIGHGEDAVVDGRVVTDKPIYQAWDEVLIEARVANPSENVIQPPARGVVTVTDPTGNVVFTAGADVNELMPGALRDLGFSLTLADAPGGVYAVTWVVHDAFSHAHLFTRSTSFTVERQLLAGLAGGVDAAPGRVYQGDPATCTERVVNLSAAALPDLRLDSQVVRVEDGAALSSHQRSVNLAAGASLVETRPIDTADLVPGEYACTLTVHAGASGQLLGTALFAVLERPIRIESRFEAGERGRLLVLLDEGLAPCLEPNCDGATRDPLGPNHSPDLATQRSALETLLAEADWSYTIVTHAADFTRELRSGGYVTYLLLSEHVKLDETVQKALREAVFRGEGLVEAGGHDQRHGRLDEALGLEFRGKHAGMSGFALADSPVARAGEADFSLVDRTLRAALSGATVIGHFSRNGHPSTEPAVTVHEYGQGRTLYAGFDLLAEMAMAGIDSLYGDLLLDALDHVHPPELLAREAGVFPVRVALDNQGIATPGRVVLTLPESVAVVDAGGGVVDGDTLIWPFDLEEGERLAFTAWLGLPAVPVEITALIQSGVAPAWVDEETLSLNLAPQPLVTVDEVVGLAETITDKVYKQARKYLDRARADSAAGDWSGALASLLRAADALIAIGTEESAGLRGFVARAIRSVSIHIE